MITYWLLIFATGVMNAIAAPISLLPDASLPSGFASWLAATGGYISIPAAILPHSIAALFVVLGFVVIVENADGIFKVVKWIYTKIPGIS